MDFGLTDEQRLILSTVREFVTRELLPLEAEAQRAELEGRSFPGPGDLRRLQQRAKTAGLWGLLTPEEYGGANLGLLMTALISMETSRALIPFSYGGYADNILYVANAEQKQRYLVPTIEGDRTSCFALTEPDTGSDATNIQMPAVRDGPCWVLNGRKVFITNGLEADFAIVFAVTDKTKGHQGGVTAFLVDRAMGWNSRPIQTMGAWRPAEISFDDVRVPEENVLGEAKSERASSSPCPGLARDGSSSRRGPSARRSGCSRWRSNTRTSGSPSAAPSPSTRRSSGCWPTAPSRSSR